MKGLFISIEGLDGSGKTTQIEAIKKHMSKKKREVVFLREPGSTAIGEKIRDILLDPIHKEMSNRTEMLLYAAARAQMVEEKLIPYLEEGKVVICDRYIDSSVAYQGYGRELNVDEVLHTNLVAINHILPDLTLYLDIHPKTTKERMKKALKADRLEIEKSDFHNRVYNGYKTLCQRFSNRIVAIPADLPIHDITEKIIAQIDQLIEREY